MDVSASLPMYNNPGMRAVNAAFWANLAPRLRAAGLDDAPVDLSQRPVVPDSIGADVLFSQTCGWPLQTIYRGQHRLVARPRYNAAGCSGSTHSAFFLVPESSSARTMENLRGKRFGLNTTHSNSGMNLPRRMLADMAGGKPFFGEVIETGSHPNSLKALQAGEIDCASVDNLTFIFGQDYLPEQVAGLRVLAQTPMSPTIPYVTSAETDDATLAILQKCLFEMSADPAARPVLDALRIERIEAAPQAEYTALLDLQNEAIALGYPEIR